MSRGGADHPGERGLLNLGEVSALTHHETERESCLVEEGQDLTWMLSGPLQLPVGTVWEGGRESKWGDN